MACGLDVDDADKDVTQTGRRLRAIVYIYYLTTCGLNFIDFI